MHWIGLMESCPNDRVTRARDPAVRGRQKKKKKKKKKKKNMMKIYKMILTSLSSCREQES